MPPKHAFRPRVTRVAPMRRIFVLDNLGDIKHFLREAAVFSLYPDEFMSATRAPEMMVMLNKFRGIWRMSPGMARIGTPHNCDADRLQKPSICPVALVSYLIWVIHGSLTLQSVSYTDVVHIGTSSEGAMNWQNTRKTVDSSSIKHAFMCRFHHTQEHDDLFNALVIPHAKELAEEFVNAVIRRNIETAWYASHTAGPVDDGFIIQYMRAHQDRTKHALELLMDNMIPNAFHSTFNMWINSRRRRPDAAPPVYMSPLGSRPALPVAERPAAPHAAGAAAAAAGMWAGGDRVVSLADFKRNLEIARMEIDPLIQIAEAARKEKAQNERELARAYYFGISATIDHTAIAQLSAMRTQAINVS